MIFNADRMDPTRTTMLRRAFMAETKSRFASFRKAVVQLVLTDDAFGLGTRSPFSVNQRLVTNAGQYAFLTSDKKLDAFNEWMDAQLNAKVLSIGKGQTVWTAKYVESAYRQGIVRAYTDVNGKKMKQKVGFYMDSRAQFLKDSFAQPETLSKVRLLATRTFEGMRGVTAAQKTQLNRILADAIANGRSPAQAARDMTNRIDSLTKSRALTIARTEIIHAHSEGQLDAFEDLGVDELGVYAEWVTAGDDRVCERCASMEGKVYTVKEARGVIPLHPNCRCTWIPTDEKPKKKLKASKVKAKAKAADVEMAAPVDRFGHRAGSQAAAINAALGEGASIEEMMQITGLSKERIASHMRHLTERGIITKNGGRFMVTTPPPVAPVVPVTPTGIKVPTLVPVPVAPKLTIPPLPAPTPPSVPAAPSGARYTKAEDYRTEVLKLKERSKAMLAAREPEIAEIEAQMGEVTQRMAEVSKNPILAQYRKLPEQERDSIKEEYYAVRDLQEGLYRKLDALNAKLAAIRKESKVSVQEARDLLREDASLKTMEFKSTTVRNTGYEDSAKEVLSWMPSAAFTDNDRSAISWLQVTLGSERNVNGTYNNLNSHIKIASKKVTKTSVSTFVHEFGHHLSYKMPSFMSAQNDFFRKRTAGEVAGPLPGFAKHIIGKRDDFGKVNVYAGRIYEDGRYPEIASVGLQALWDDPVAFAEKDPEWFNLIVSQLKGIL